MFHRGHQCAVFPLTRSYPPRPSHMASLSGPSPSPVTADTAYKGIDSASRTHAESGETVGLVQSVDLVCRDQLRLLRQRLPRRFRWGDLVGGQLMANDVEIVFRTPARGRRNVDHMDENVSALEMAQKGVAQTVPFVSAFDEPWHVREHKSSGHRSAGLPQDAESGS